MGKHFEKKYIVVIMDYFDPKKVFKSIVFGNQKRAESFYQKLLKEGVKVKFKQELIRKKD